jgi:TetR/AcrR family transcriptional regulator, cholesterol catabolism regulator
LSVRAKSVKSFRSVRSRQARAWEPKRANGKREANKLDKLDRIKRAARELFTTVGYDEATTRQIAKKAGVALGTVFTYATTKRDLLFLVSDDLLAGARDRAAKSFRHDRSLEHNFVAFCAVFYRVIGAEPKLSKLVFRDLSFYDSEIHSIAVLANRVQTLKSVENLVIAAHETGEIELPVPPDFVAWLLFSTFQAENRRWLALERRGLEEGLTHLWTSVAILLNGLSTKPRPYQPKRAELREILAKA